MDPITLALATFGVQKLRGQSTKRAFRDALIVGGIGQLGSMTQAGQNIGLSGFGLHKQQLRQALEYRLKEQKQQQEFEAGVQELN